MGYAIRLKDVHKQYPLYKRPLDRLFHLFNKNIKTVGTYHALRGIDVDFPRGESIGVLGKNGAGKSTLLKIVTGVVTPTSGECIVNGKVSALLELNAGFDNELTGYENIFLKATLLGFSREEIEGQVDDIIDFADIGEHMYQPVRTYSSGMRSRLGFSIAVHVNPDILIIDEALSVGDDMFRLKCLNKVRSFKESGKTILFVSHSLTQVQSFCSKAMWLKDGKMEFYGNVNEGIALYSNYLKEEKAKIKEKKNKKSTYKLETNDDYIERKKFYLTDSNGKETRTFQSGQSVTFNIDFLLKKEIKGARFSWTLLDAERKEVFSTDKQSDDYIIDQRLGLHHLSVTMPNVPLLTGRYFLRTAVRDETGVLDFTLSIEQHFDIKSSIAKATGIVYLQHELKDEVSEEITN